MVDIIRILFGIAFRILHIFSPEFRNMVSDIRLIGAIIFEAFAAFYALTHGPVLLSYILNGVGLMWLIFALYFRWSYDTSGIDTGMPSDHNLTDYNKTYQSDKKGKYDF